MKAQRKEEILHNNYSGELLHNNFRGEILHNFTGDILHNDACNACGSYSNFMGIGSGSGLSPIVKVAIGIGVIIGGLLIYKKLS